MSLRIAHRSSSAARRAMRIRFGHLCKDACRNSLMRSQKRVYVVFYLVAIALEEGSSPYVLLRERPHLVKTFTCEFRQPYHTAKEIVGRSS